MLAPETLTRWCLGAAETTRVSLRPWRLEQALAVLAAGRSDLAVAAARWLVAGSGGPGAPGLELMLAKLNRDGALTYSSDWGCYVVDLWWRLEARSELAALDVADVTDVARAAELFDELEVANRSARLGPGGVSRPA